MGLLLRFARQWIAGEVMEAAIARTRRSNARGIGTILNLLGEHYEKPAEVAGAVEEYMTLLRQIKADGLDASVSIKLTQCGLRLSKDFCLENVLRILAQARALGVFLWMDMESSPWTDATLEIYERCLQEWDRVGVCLQAYLKRTEGDLGRLLPLGGKVRLVKGAYREPSSVALKSRAEITANYLKLMELLFQEGEYFAVATHDLALVERARALARDADGRFEFEMLMGVRDPLKVELVKEGFRTVEYVPYGPRWLPYFSRRIHEKPSNLITMVKSLIYG